MEVADDVNISDERPGRAEDDDEIKVVGEGQDKKGANTAMSEPVRKRNRGLLDVVALPGDDLTNHIAPSGPKLRLGAGLVHRGGSVRATRAGLLRHKPPQTYWIDANQKRYIARVEDQVVGLVEERMGDFYRMNLFGSSPALLNLLSFEGASKRNKPNLGVGALVYCRVVAADKDMEPELTCLTGHHGVAKDWNTGQSTFGELKDGMAVRCSLMHARSLMRPESAVLNALGRRVPFEVAVGVNGVVWVNAGTPAHIIAVCNAILNAEVMSDGETLIMVDRLLPLSGGGGNGGGSGR